MRWVREAMASRAMPRARLLLPVGLAVAAAGLSVLVSVVPTLPGEEAILEAVRQTEQPLLNEALRSLDCLGSPWVIVASLLALAAVLWVRGRRWEAMASLLIIPMELMTLGLREVIDRPRPSLQALTTMPESAGFPSGTTLHAVLFFGFIAYLCHIYVRPRKLRLALQALLVLIIAVASYSRVYLGVHWPTDIIGGWLYGGFFLWVITVIGLPFFSKLSVERGHGGGGGKADFSHL